MQTSYAKNAKPIKILLIGLQLGYLILIELSEHIRLTLHNI